MVSATQHLEGWGLLIPCSDIIASPGYRPPTDCIELSQFGQLYSGAHLLVARQMEQQGLLLARCNGHCRGEE
jgi:hypothetical protein